MVLEGVFPQPQICTCCFVICCLHWTVIFEVFFCFARLMLLVLCCLLWSLRYIWTTYLKEWNHKNNIFLVGCSKHKYVYSRAPKYELFEIRAIWNTLRVTSKQKRFSLWYEECSTELPFFHSILSRSLFPGGGGLERINCFLIILNGEHAIEIWVDRHRSAVVVSRSPAVYVKLTLVGSWYTFFSGVSAF